MGNPRVIILSLVVLLTACTGSSGFNSVRGVDDSKLLGQTIGAVLEMLGPPYAYYATPGDRDQILTYETNVRGGKPNLAGCLLLIGLGAADCPQGGTVVQQCVALQFGPDKRLVDIKRPQFIAGPCSTKSDDRFLPKTRRSLEAISR